MAAGDGEGFVAVDAAKLGSPAHRVRVFCTNLAPVEGIRERYAAYDRDRAMGRKEAQGCLDLGWMSQHRKVQ
jgi:bisphosphoglycerate-independent phosphoglycerate mutase (AlkP superfamily)